MLNQRLTEQVYILGNKYLEIFYAPAAHGIICNIERGNFFTRY